MELLYYSSQTKYLDTENRGKWIGNVAKIFVECSRYLFCGLALHKTWQSTIRAHTTNQCIVYEQKTKDARPVRGQGPSNINLNLFVCLFDVYRPPYPCLSIN